MIDRFKLNKRLRNFWNRRTGEFISRSLLKEKYGSFYLPRVALPDKICGECGNKNFHGAYCNKCGLEWNNRIFMVVKSQKK